MSLQWELPRDIPDDTYEIGVMILRHDNVYRRIGERFDAVFPEEVKFRDLYEVTGRGAVSPLLMALVTVFQMLEKVPDRFAAEWVVSRIDWKYALHLPLTYTGFHFSDLSAFRKRLLNHKSDREVFGLFLERLKELGLIKHGAKMRTDSTHVLALVERLSQLELVTESIRLALQAAMENAREWGEQHIPEAFREAYESRASGYGLSQAKVQAKLIQAGRDGFWLLAEIDRLGTASLASLTQMKVLRRVLEQQFPSGPEEPPAMKRPAGGKIIESPHEPEARRSAKRGQPWTGYKTQITETCDKDKPRLIVDIDATSATANDSPELPEIQHRLGAQGTLPEEQYVDQGYVSGKRIADSQDNGIDLVGIPLGDTQGPEGFRQADFEIDEIAQQARCPAGETSVTWSERSAEESEPQTIQIRFDRTKCAQCTSFGTCTKSAQGRTLELHPYRQVLAARRLEAATDAYRSKMHLRAGIEGTISELVRAHSLRQARYRGTRKLRLQCLFTGIALNLKRLARWWAKQGQRKGLAMAN